MADNSVESEGSGCDLSKMKVADLKRELKSRGLSTAGNKTELLERLQSALQGGDAGLESTGEEENTEDYVLEDDDLGEDNKANDSIDAALTEDIALTSPTHSEASPIKAVAEKENDHQTVNHLKPTPVAISTAVPELADTHTTTKQKDVSLQEVGSTTERLELRAKRFNMPLSEDARKQARAERFGTSSIKKTTTSGSVLKGYTANSEGSDALRKRAERFGMPLPKSVQQVVDKEKLKQRAERFGASLALQKGDDNEQLLKRKQRFGPVTKDQELEEKKKKRAERFST